MIHPATEENIQRAVELLHNGDLVVIPTETVYGLGADASNESAIDKIYQVKNRPKINPLISHYAEIKELSKDVELSTKARLLAKNFWPGPLTLILNKTTNSRISEQSSAGLKTAAVRIPQHPISLKLLKLFAKPLAAPSANPSGRLSPSEASHVYDLFQGNISFILDGGSCNCGIESTIVDLSSDTVKLLRYGSISKEQIENTLQEEILVAATNEAIKAPGMLLKHYSPTTKLESNLSFEELLSRDTTNQKIAVLIFGSKKNSQSQIEQLQQKYFKIINLSQEGNLEEAANKLFTSLHQLDKMALDKILVEAIPKQGLGLAINDKLRRATA